MEERCSACKGVYHEATGHRFSARARLCGPCAREFVKFLRQHTKRRWGGINFYEHAQPPPKSGRYCECWVCVKNDVYLEAACGGEYSVQRGGGCARESSEWGVVGPHPVYRHVKARWDCDDEASAERLRERLEQKEEPQ